MENATHIIGAFAARRLSDESLFDRAIRGDAVAFSEVYRRYEKRVYGFCLARALDREAAADATQEVFIRLLKATPGSVDHPRAWLFAVARNVSTDALRKRTQLREAGEADENAPAWESMTAADTADKVADRADARAAFLALRRMRPRYRTALILREIHGQSSADIAEAMGVRSVGAVDTLVSRARDAFGVAYASLSELPQACNRNVELMYRSRGTGITGQEAVALRAHLASCERCREEEALADDPKRLSGLLPLLVPAGGAAHSLLGHAALATGNQSGVDVVQRASDFLQRHLHTVGARIAAGALAATLVAAPVVAVKTMQRSPKPVVASIAIANPMVGAPSVAGSSPNGTSASILGPGRSLWTNSNPNGMSQGGGLARGQAGSARGHAAGAGGGSSAGAMRGHSGAASHGRGAGAGAARSGTSMTRKSSAAKSSHAPAASAKKAAHGAKSASSKSHGSGM